MLLFYPSSGGDTLEPLTQFHTQVNHFIFCDIHSVALPVVQGSFERPEFVHSLDCTFPVKLVSQHFEQRDRTGRIELNRPYASRLLSMACYYYREVWEFTSGRRITIDIFIEDSIEVFKRLNKLGVFFYRGDSMNESGSGVRWLGPNLFPKVVNKLMDGGLIVTDGSNPDQNQLDTPWMELYQHSHWNYPDLKEGERPKDFIYHDRSFRIIGELTPRYGKTYLWKVESHNLP